MRVCKIAWRTIFFPGQSEPDQFSFPILQDTRCDVGTTRIVWLKINPDNEILFRLMDRLRPDAGRRYLIKEQGTEGNIVGIGEDIGQVATEVKIAFPMSHNVLTIVEEYVQ